MWGPWIKVNWKWSYKRWQEGTINSLGISELQWMGMGKFNSDHYVYYCGQESLRRNGVALIVNKRVENAVLIGCNLKNDRMISICFQGKPFNITVIQVYAATIDAEEAEVLLIVTVNSIKRTHMETSQGKRCAGQGPRGHQTSSFPCLLPWSHGQH